MVLLFRSACVAVLFFSNLLCKGTGGVVLWGFRLELIFCCIWAVLMA